jgi:hypothetical protein
MVTGPRTERRLAAILAADVVGYSRLMGADDAGTLQALKLHRREVVDPAIAAHHGRIVKTTGDGMLVNSAAWSMLSVALWPCSSRWRNATVYVWIPLTQQTLPASSSASALTSVISSLMAMTFSATV